MNETSAKEWLTKAWHHFSSGRLLYEADHYTDVIAVDFHYAVEVALKSILALQNKKIVKTHDLIEISELIQDYIEFDLEETKLLILISTYHLRGSYPPRDRKMPSREELKDVLEFTETLFQDVCKRLNIKESEVKI